MFRRGKTRYGFHGMLWLGYVRYGEVRSGFCGTARHGRVWHGFGSVWISWLNMVRYGLVGQGRLGWGKGFVVRQGGVWCGFVR